MSYIQFDKSKLINLEYSLGKEILRSNRAGTYASTTIVGCNTRKYHGLLICPVEHLDSDKHVLLSSLDETIIHNDYEFNLGIHKYDGEIFYPRGHKYIRDYEVDKIPKIIYRIGSDLLTKERILVDREQQILIKYHLNKEGNSMKLRLKPFLAFRNMHTLSKANLYANTKVKYIQNGISTKLYNGYPNLYMQLSKDAEFVVVPDWYYNIHYEREQERGYEYTEDLFVPGYFEFTMRPGETVIFSASTQEASPTSLKRKFSNQLKQRISRDSFKASLINSAQQFIVKNGRKTEIISGFPWFGSWSRDTFISAPGLTLTIGDTKTFRAILDTMIPTMKNGLFPNAIKHDNPLYNSADAPLWFIYAIQQYVEETHIYTDTWNKYGKALKKVLLSFKKGTDYNIKMSENGLIYAGEKGKALTWMDAMVNGKAVTGRTGYNVEINALWYNAVCFALELAGKVKDNKFIEEWREIPELIRYSFISIFWDEEKGYLADYSDGDMKCWDVRPNQVFAVSLKYSPLQEEMMKSILDIVRNELLTPKGLRTLSPKNPAYKGFYEGNQEERDLAYHQGTVWPWLLEPYCTAYLRLYKESGIPEITKVYERFEEDMGNHGIGSISEIYDGNPPHHPKGAISQAWSVAALLRINQMIEKFNEY